MCQWPNKHTPECQTKSRTSAAVPMGSPEGRLAVVTGGWLLGRPDQLKGFHADLLTAPD